MTKLIIKGAIYTDGNVLLRPHFTGEYYIVDCTEYYPKEIVIEQYDKETAKRMLANPYLEYDGKRYYECEFSPYNVDEDFDLLSDLSDLEFYDETGQF